MAPTLSALPLVIVEISLYMVLAIRKKSFRGTEVTLSHIMYGVTWNYYTFKYILYFPNFIQNLDTFKTFVFETVKIVFLKVTSEAEFAVSYVVRVHPIVCQSAFHTSHS